MSDTSLLFTIFAVDKATSVLAKTGSAVDKLALGVGLAGAAIAVKTTKMAADFQTAMLRVQTGAGEQASALKSVSAGVLDLATKTGDGANELAKALYTVESGGQHGAAGLLVLKAAAQGAKAEGADLNEVADATTSVLQDYHLKASDAALVTSQMVTAVGDGKTTFQNFASSLSSVLPIASAAHISFADISGAIASMTVHGMSADQATQNLADTIRHMQAPTLAQSKALAQMGINSADLSDMLSRKGLTGTLQYLSTTILSKMGPAGKVLLGTFNQSKQAAADVKAMVASMPKPLQELADKFIAGKISSQDWNGALRGLTPTVANQMRQFATLEKRSTGFSDALRSGTPAAVSYTAALKAATGDATGLNTALMLTGENTAYTNKAVSDVAKTTSEAGGNVKGWSEIQQTFNYRMSVAKEKMQVVGIQVGNVLLPVMTKLMTVVGDTVGWFTKHKTVAQALGIAVGVLAAGLLAYKTYLFVTATATKVATAAQWLWNLAMDANPVGAVILAVMALVAVIYLLWTRSAGFRDFFIGMWHWILVAAKAVGHWFAHDFVDFFKNSWHWIQDKFTAGAQWISNKITNVILFFTGLPGKIKTAFMNLGSILMSPFKWAFNQIVNLWNNTVGKFHINIPSWVPLVGGKSFAFPQLPHLATGGTAVKPGWSVVGEKGPERLYMPVGASVVPLSHRGGGPVGGGGTVHVHLHLNGSTKAVVQDVSGYIRKNFQGNVQLALSGN